MDIDTAAIPKLEGDCTTLTLPEALDSLKQAATNTETRRNLSACVEFVLLIRSKNPEDLFFGVNTLVGKIHAAQLAGEPCDAY